MERRKNCYSVLGTVKEKDITLHYEGEYAAPDESTARSLAKGDGVEITSVEPIFERFVHGKSRCLFSYRDINLHGRRVMI